MHTTTAPPGVFIPKWAIQAFVAASALILGGIGVGVAWPDDSIEPLPTPPEVPAEPEINRGPNEGIPHYYNSL